VLSTNWTRRYRFSKVVQRLSPGLRDWVIGATYHSQMSGDGFDLLRRWAQIANDLQRRKPAVWLALDDDHIGWPREMLDHLVVSDPYEGNQSTRNSGANPCQAFGASFRPACERALKETGCF
jgi:hypothetical protein